MGPIPGALLVPVMVALSITVAKGRAAIKCAKAWHSEHQQLILLGEKSEKKTGKNHPYAGRSELCLGCRELQCGVSLSLDGDGAHTVPVAMGD